MNPVKLKNWEVFQPIPLEISEALSAYPPYLRQLLYNRNIKTEADALRYLNSDGAFYDPFLLTDMDRVVDRLLRAIDQNECIAVYGDYDVDGVTATVLMVEVLTCMGANAKHHIPNRFDEGYGLNTDAIQGLADQGVKVILTVDCGIRSPREVEFAASLGMDLIISDHHHPKDTLPQAHAVICQKREGDEYPYKELAGVGLAYKIAQALFQKRPVSGWNADDWLDLVALGTVADIVPLTGENRSLVRKGISLIRQGKRKGLSSLIRVAGRQVEKITAADIGFAIGPRLNAGGRIKTPEDPFQLLISKDENEIGSLAQTLDNQNSKRQDMTKTMQHQAEEKFAGKSQVNLIADRDEEYSSGVIGLVASKLVETYYRPAIVGHIEDGFTRASCRSIPDFHITNALDQCADLLVRHGGHSMAAGFTVANENWDKLIERLTQIADQQFGTQEITRTVMADVELPLDELPPNILGILRQLEPTGMENPGALFISRNVACMNFRKIGADQSHLKFKVKFHTANLDAVAWNQADYYSEQPCRYDLLFTFEENNYNGNSSLQLNVRDIRPTQA